MWSYLRPQGVPRHDFKCIPREIRRPAKMRYLPGLVDPQKEFPETHKIKTTAPGNGLPARPSARAWGPEGAAFWEEKKGGYENGQPRPGSLDTTN